MKIAQKGQSTEKKKEKLKHNTLSKSNKSLTGIPKTKEEIW